MCQLCSESIHSYIQLAKQLFPCQAACSKTSLDQLIDGLHIFPVNHMTQGASSYSNHSTFLSSTSYAYSYMYLMEEDSPSSSRGVSAIITSA